MKKKENKTIQYLSITAIVVSVLISGYIILKPNNQTGSQTQGAGTLAPMVDGKQLIQMKVLSVNYDPNTFTVKVGVPVKWEITSSGQPGCDAGELVARGLMDPVYLNPNVGQITIAEFTPQTPGEYTFSCPMGMVRGKIVVVN